MLTHSHSSPGPTGPPPVSLHGMRTRLLLAFLAAFFFFIFFLMAVGPDRAHNPGALPLGFVVLCAGFVLLPFVACHFLFSSGKVEFIAAGAGVACVFFGAFLLVSPLALGLMGYFLGMSAWAGHGSDPRWLAAEVALLAFLAVSLSILWSGIRIGKIQWHAFVMAMGATVLYLVISVPVLGAVGNEMSRRAWRNQEQADRDVNMPAILARQKIVALAGCLFQSHMRNPEAEYPASLNPPAQDWKCDTKFAPDAVPEYTFAYIPQPDTSGHIAGFQLSAIPKAKGVTNRNPIMIDNSGLTFVDYRWFMENVVPKVMGSGEVEHAQIKYLKGNIERYMKDKNEGLAPPALNADAIAGPLNEIPSIEDGGMRLETRDYEIRYFPPLAGSPKEFALSTQCKSYGLNCLRSYFSDYDGGIHATSEPRQATAGDPLASPCEFTFWECTDVDWFP